MRVNEKMRKVLSIVLTLCMVLSYIPAPAYAVGADCSHHTEHTAECGYVPAVEGVPCTHVHSENCYKALNCQRSDTHECTVESGCITMERNCQHTHGGCGYSEGTAEVPCGHVHDDACGYVAASEGTACGHSCADQGCTLNEDGTYTCLHAEHDEVCGYAAPVEGKPCTHVEHLGCGYAPATEGTPCTHVCEVKVNSSESCYKLLCSHKDGGHDEVCGYVAAVEGHECHYECAECAIAPANDEPGDETPVCTCNAVEGEAHTEGCALYVAPADPVCTCEAAEGEAHTEGCPLYVAPSDPVCTCEAAEGEAHAEGCALYVLPSDPVCTCEAAEGEAHAEGCDLYVAPAEPVCYCAEKCTAEVFNEYCEVCGFDYTACTGTDTAVAYAEGDTVSVTINGETTYYTSIKDAVATANQSGNATITLLQDTTTGERLDITNSATLDLNGNTLSCATDFADVYEAMVAVTTNGAKLTIIDSVGGGKLDGTGTTFVLVVGDPWTVGLPITSSAHISSGTVSGKVQMMQGTSMTVSGGTVENNTVFDTIEMYTETTLNVSGGEILNTDAGDAIGNTNGSAVIISGGTVNASGGYACAIRTQHSGRVEISGGNIFGAQYDLRFDSNDTVELTGGTFPGGITVYGKTLNECLGNGFSYWAMVGGQNTMLTELANDATDITDKGDITIRAICDHKDVKLDYITTETTHTPVCSVCNWTGEATEHTGGTATCTEQAKCEVCGTSYGEISGHTAAPTYAPTADGSQHVATYSCCGSAVTENHTTDETTDQTCQGYYCTVCEKWYGEANPNAHAFDENGKCTVCGADCTHESFTDGKCDDCGITGGYCGDVIWTYDEVTKAFAITGTGAMKDYNSYSDRPWNENISKNATSVTISEGVTRIGEMAFHTFTQITAVTVPASVESIGYCAFTSCVAMQSITFSEGSRLTAFDDCVFQNCTALKQITLPAGVTSVDWSVFSGCYALTDIFVEEGSTTLKDIDGVLYTADGTTLLLYPFGKKDTAFTTPAGVTTIGEPAFKGNVNLKTITLSKGVTTIGEEAFWWMDSLTTVTIPSSVTSIGRAAFKSCDNLTTINAPCNWDTENPLYTFDRTVAVIVGDHTPNADGYTVNENGTHSFTCDCGTEVTEEHTFDESGKCTVCGAVCTHSSFADGKCTVCGIPGGYCGSNENEGSRESLWWYFQDGILTISGAGDMAERMYADESGWSNMSDSITALAIDKGVTGISSNAFMLLSNLEQVTFAEDSLLTTIGENAFDGCSSLKEITIPASVSDIDGNPFPGCTAMETVHVAPGNTVYKDIDGVLYTIDGTTLMSYPYRKVSYTFITPKGVTTIGDGAFAGTKVRAVELTNDLTTVGSSAFYNCTMLYEITISNSVKEIDESAFWSCTELRSVHAPCGWQENPLYEFENNDYIGNEYVNVRIDAHDLSSWVPNQDGLTHKQVCSACDYVERDNVPHSTNAAEDKAATCVDLAYCSVCDSSYGELGGHSFDANGKCTLCEHICDHADSQHTTVTNDGNTHSFTCSVCQAEVTGQTHDYTHDAENHKCICGDVEKYTVRLGGDYGAKIVSVNGDTEAPFTAEHGKKLTVVLENVASDTRDDVMVDMVYIGKNSYPPIEEEFPDLKDTTLTFDEGIVTSDVVINAEALLSVTVKLAGGSVVSAYARNYSVDGDRATIKDNSVYAGINYWPYRYSFAKAGYTLVGMKNSNGMTYGPDVNIHLTSDMELTLIWQCNHDTTETVDNGDGKTHNIVCANTECNDVVEENVAHTYVNGVCECTYACKHENATYPEITDTQHKLVCSCGYEVTEDHTRSYAASGNVITESCAKCNATLGTATITAENTTYDGEPFHAAVVKTGAFTDSNIGITYSQNGEALNESVINAGSYTASITVGSQTASVDFTITAATPAITWENETATVTYTGSPAVITAPVVKLVNGETYSGDISYSYTGTSSGNGLPTDAGTYEITASIAAQGNYTAATSTNKLTLTIEKQKITVDRMSWTVPQNTVYNGNEYIATLNGTLPAGVKVTTSGDKATDAGNYIAKAEFSLAEGYSADNYEIVNGEDLTADWSIEAKNISGAEITLGTALTYNGEEQIQTVSGVKIGDLTVTYTVSGNAETNAGDYTLTVTGSGNFEGTATAEWSIAKAEPEIVWNTGATNSYGANMYITAYIKGVDGNMIPGTAVATVYDAEGNELNTVICIKTDSTGTYFYNWLNELSDGTYLTPGSYVVKLTYQGNENYNAKTVELVTYTINKAQAKISVDTTPITVTYGETVELPTATSDFGTVSCDKTSDELVNAGIYTVTYSVEGTDNYEGDCKTVTVTIEKLAVAEPTVTGNYIYTGTKQTAQLAGVDSCMTIASGNKAVGAGSYEVVITLDGNHKWADGSDGKVQWNIAKAKAEITVDTKPITAVYGETVKLPTASTNFGTVSCDKTADDLVNAGTYTVTYSVAGTNNYDGDIKTITVTVEQLAVAEPTVTGTYTYTGKEQTVTLAGVESYMTIASGNKAVGAGSYEVVITLDSNHKWADGSDGKVQWRIGKSQAEITVNTDPITVTYGESVELPAAVTNFGTVTCDKAAADLVNAGTYTVTYTVDGTDNYNGDTKTITVTVKAKVVNQPVIEGIEAVYVQNGNAIAPVPTAVKDGTTVIDPSEYTLAYENNTAAGTATVKIVDKDGGNYTVNGSMTFRIVEHEHTWTYTTDSKASKIIATCSNADGHCPNTNGGSVSIQNPDELTYDGSSKDAETVYESWQPDEITITYNNVDRVNVTGKEIVASIGVVGAGIQSVYTIVPAALPNATLSADSSTYTGQAHPVTVELGTLVKDTDYTVTIPEDMTNVGIKTITVTGKGNYEGTQNLTYTITKGSDVAAPAPGIGYTIDYAKETITIADGFEVIDSDGKTVVSGNAANYFGKTLKVRYAETQNTEPSAYTSFTLAERPAVPNVTIHNETIKGKADGKITGLDATMEYSTDGGKHWISVETTDASEKNLAVGTTIAVRIKATQTAPCSENKTGTVAAGTDITVTYAQNGQAANGMPAQIRNLSYGNKLTKPADPTAKDTDFAFRGWYKDAECTVAWDFEKDTVTEETVTIYAKWEQVYFSVTAEIQDHTGEEYQGQVQVKLMRGDSEIDSVTGMEGSFRFSRHVEAGMYNLVAVYTDSRGEHTKTELITVDHDEAFVLKLPAPGVNSHLTVGDNVQTPDVMVGELDAEAESVKQQTGAIKVEIEMTVTSKTESQVSNTVVTAVEATTNHATVEYLDITVTKQINDGAKTEMSETANLMEIVIPYNTSGKTNLRVFRHHGGQLQEFAQGSGADRTFYYANGYIHIFTRCFSNYMISYEVSRTVTFDANGGSVGIESLTTQTNGTLSALPIPTRAHYVFKGWYTAKSGGTKVTTDTVFNGDATIYAQWGGYAITVADAKNGTVTVNRSEAPGATEIIITVTPKTGYKMSTLTVKDAAGKYYVISTDNNSKYYFTMPDADVTVKVIFSKISTSIADLSNPKTDDDFNIVVWSGLMLVSGLGVALLLAEEKKRRTVK